MKKTQLIKIVVFSLMVIYILMSFIIFFFNPSHGNLALSLNIEDSKEKGVFEAEYKINKDSIKVGNNMFLTFNDIWLEILWENGRHHGDVFIKKGQDAFSLCFVVPEEKSYSYSNYYQSYAIQDTTGSLLGLHGVEPKTIVLQERIDFFKKPLKLYVVKVNELRNDSVRFLWDDPTIIDSFIVSINQ